MWGRSDRIVRAGAALWLSLATACTVEDVISGRGASELDTDDGGTSIDGDGGDDGPGGDLPPPGDDGDGVEACGEPSVPPDLQPAQADWACPQGATYDAAHHLCVGDGLAIGPMSPPMVEACRACGLDAICDGDDWPEALAQALRGTGPCWPGTTADITGLYCVDATHAWGPFPPAMVAACEAAGGGSGCASMRWARDFAAALAPSDRPWSWILPIDLGLRSDSGGAGHFGASRLNNPGGHSGLDILAPVGTPLLAACDGEVLSGWASGYGNIVQLVCPVPTFEGDDPQVWASMLYAHLDLIEAANGSAVARGEIVGTVGKSGNAGGSAINPHVHFEIAIHGSRSEALAETHASSNHAGNAAADAFETAIGDDCWVPSDFDSLSGPRMKGRRPDPFLVLACLSDDKAPLEAPDGSLQVTPVPWRDHYTGTFDVDTGAAP